MSSTSEYCLVRLPNGAHSVRSLRYGETCHPGVGPMVEADTLYVRGLRLRERLAAHGGEFVVWDIGFGAAANALTVLGATADLPVPLRIVSFDETTALLRFALDHSAQLDYLRPHEPLLRRLLEEGAVTHNTGGRPVRWDLQMGDFPHLIRGPQAGNWPKPHLILFDPFSPARNPAMWTAPLFADLFRALDPERPCVLATYSRSTMTRVALLLAGFEVGVGDQVGAKEETTVAANTPALVDHPLDARWLERARRSPSAEPLWTPAYRRAGLAPATWNRLCQCRQFH
ncbi:MAG TPA: MnmC family methyltransferase [Methylomirabilota bacterium]|nr:MnmC family methyltransferase [Methylomirabilota bacterium]